jgi:O-antigen/teichoic acid export membrane protein
LRFLLRIDLLFVTAQSDAACPKAEDKDRLMPRLAHTIQDYAESSSLQQRTDTPASHTTDRDRPASTGRIILRNSFMVTGGEWISKGLNFAFTIYTVRLLGETGLGKYATIVAFVGLFGIFFELGMTQYVQRSIARDRKLAQTLFWNMVALRLIFAVTGILALTSLAYGLGYERSIVLGILLYTSTFLFAAILMPLTTILTANERFDLSTASQIVNQACMISVGLFFLHLGSGFYALIYTGFVAMPIQIALCLWAIRRHQLGPLRFNITPRTWPAFLRASMPFGLSSVALTLSFNADVVIISLFFSAGVVGWYNAAYRLVITLVSIAGGFLESFTPSLARQHVHDPGYVRTWVRKSVLGLALFALPIPVGISILAPRIIDLLYGSAYGPAAAVLALLCWDVPLRLFNAFCGNITIATGLERQAARIYLLSAVLNVALNLAAVPVLGMLGAAGITILTDSICAIRFHRLIQQHICIDKYEASLARIALAAALMGLFVWLVRPLPLPLVIACGVLCYGIAVWRLGLVNHTTTTMIRHLLGRSAKAI